MWVISLASMPDLHTKLCFGNCQTAPWTRVLTPAFFKFYTVTVYVCIIASYDSEAYKWLHTSHSLAANSYKRSRSLPSSTSPPPPPPPQYMKVCTWLVLSAEYGFRNLFLRGGRRPDCIVKLISIKICCSADQPIM